MYGEHVKILVHICTCPVAQVSINKQHQHHYGIPVVLISLLSTGMKKAFTFINISTMYIHTWTSSIPGATTAVIKNLMYGVTLRSDSSSAWLFFYFRLVIWWLADSVWHPTIYYLLVILVYRNEVHVAITWRSARLNREKRKHRTTLMISRLPRAIQTSSTWFYLSCDACTGSKQYTKLW